MIQVEQIVLPGHRRTSPTALSRPNSAIYTSLDKVCQGDKPVCASSNIMLTLEIADAIPNAAVQRPYGLDDRMQFVGS